MASKAEDLGPALLGVAWSFAGLATIVVSLRAYVRHGILHKTRIDDWLIFATWSLAIMDSIFCTVAVSWGLGQHIDTLQPEQAMYSTKYIYLCEFFSIMSPGIGRISYAFLLLEIVPPTKARRYFLYAVIGAQFVVDLGTVIISFSQCQPIQGFWDRNTRAHCWPPEVQMYTGFLQGSVCSVVDLLLALFPASLFWNLQMKMSTKVTLSALMGSGIFAMVCSIVKTIELQAISEGDLTHAMATLAIWWTLEAYMVLIAASIPTLRPLTSRSRRQSQPNIDGFTSPYQRSSKVQLFTDQIMYTDPFETLGQPFNMSKSREDENTSDDCGHAHAKSVATAGASLSDVNQEPGTITKQVRTTVEYEAAVRW